MDRAFGVHCLRKVCAGMESHVKVLCIVVVILSRYAVHRCFMFVWG